jgi:hypothetical protein
MTAFASQQSNRKGRKNQLEFGDPAARFLIRLASIGA